MGRRKSKISKLDPNINKVEKESLGLKKPKTKTAKNKKDNKEKEIEKEKAPVINNKDPVQEKEYSTRKQKKKRISINDDKSQSADENDSDDNFDIAEYKNMVKNMLNTESEDKFVLLSESQSQLEKFRKYLKEGKSFEVVNTDKENKVGLNQIQLSIPKEIIKNIVVSMVQEFRDNTETNITKKAVEIFHVAVETEILTRLENCNRIASNSARVTLQKKDMKCLYDLEYNLSQKYKVFGNENEDL